MDGTPKIEINADVSESVNEIIKKSLLSASEQFGMALGNVFGLLNTVTLPAKLANIYAQRNFEKYEQKIKDIPKDNIKEVEPEIAIPIIEKLSYTSNEDLANAYANLLANASQKDKVNLIHPGFINKLQNLAPDEVNILEYLRKNKKLTFVYFEFKLVNSVGINDRYKIITTPLTGIEKELDIKTEQMAVHLNNLVSLSILKDHPNSELDQKDDYINLISTYSYIEKMCLKGIDEKRYDGFDKLVIKKSYFSVTPLGEIFIDSCTSK